MKPSETDQAKSGYFSALDRTVGIGTPECHRFREKIFRKHLWLSHNLAARYLQINRKQGYVAANNWLRKASESLKLGQTGLTADCSDQEIKDYCRAKSRKMERDIKPIGKKLGGEAALNYAREACEKACISFPLDIKPNDTEETIKEKKAQALMKCMDELFWRRNLRTNAKRQCEQLCRNLGMVSAQTGLYCSNQAFQRRQHEKKQTGLMLEGLIATNEEGYSMSLAEAAEKGQANPRNRHSELMVRLKGYDELAQAMRLAGIFITITCPSKYHAVLKSNNKLNPKYGGYTPKEGQEHLALNFTRIRSELQHHDIETFGFRIAEPNHDGTPHWHLLLFTAPENVDQVKEIYTKHSTTEDYDEIKNDVSTRIDFMDIDFKEYGSSIGYLAKYIAKNIDGKDSNGNSIGSDHEALGNDDLEETALRVETWASTWGIRQFQQIGSVSVTVYRELRKCFVPVTDTTGQVIKDSDGNIKRTLDLSNYEGPLKGVGYEELAAIAEAADKGDWAEFCRLMGGPLVKRKDQPIRAFHVLNTIRNKYGEFCKVLKGIITKGGGTLISRPHTWTVTLAPIGELYKSGEDRRALDLCQ